MANEIVPPKTAPEVWAFVTEIGKAEREFNTLQAGYRKLASGWLLAVFGGLGFLLEPITMPGGEVQLGVKDPRLLLAVGLAGWLGILVLWLVDIPLYHRLLVSYFLEGYDLEAQYKWLPQVRHEMSKTFATIFATIFYFFLATAAFFAAWLTIWSVEAPLPQAYCWSFPVVVVVDLAVLICAVCMHRGSSSLISKIDGKYNSSSNNS